MKTSGQMGLAIVTGGLAFAGAVQGNLVLNGSFETEDADWGVFSIYSHSTQVYYSGPAPAGAGGQYGWAWGETTLGTVSQVIDLTSTVSPTTIDGGSAIYDFNAWLSSYTSDTDYALVGLAWNDAIDGTGAGVGAGVTFDGNNGADPSLVGSADAGGLADPGTAWTQDNWSLYQNTGTVPSGARSAIVSITSNSVSNNGNDAYVDLVSLDVIPEPSTGLLLGLGGLAVALRKRRR